MSAGHDLARRKWPLQRRRLLGGPLAALLLGAGPARAIGWMPYPPDQVMRIDPVLTQGNEASATVRIDPVITGFELPQDARRALEHLNQPGVRLPPLAGEPPQAYVRTGQRHGVPPWLLYGVALQESRIKFGQRDLPYPWTLCVQGVGLRYASYGQSLAALKRYAGARITNVDCGAMQVNWHWHKDKLGSFEQALDPYFNLAVGAQILRRHFEVSGHWRQAIALYHAGSDQTDAAHAMPRPRSHAWPGWAWPCRCPEAVMRERWPALALACACGAAWAGQPLAVIDAGAAVPTSPYLSALIAGQGQSGVLAGVEFPIRTRLAPGHLPGPLPVLQARWMTQPIAVLGDDQASLDWLARHGPALQRQAAVGLVLAARSEASFKRVQRAARGLPVAPGPDPWLEAQLIAQGVSVLPVLIGLDGLAVQDMPDAPPPPDAPAQRERP